MTRTDAHRPSAIQPENYEFVAFDYLPSDGDPLGSALFMQDQRRAKRAHMDRTGGTYSGHQHGGNCHICGSVNAIYTATFFHHPSNAYVRTGLDCAEKLECRGIEGFRRNVTNALEARAGKAKAQAVLAQAGLGAAWEIYTATDRAGFKYEESTVTDIVSRLVQYGSTSDKAMNYVRSLCDRIANRAQIAAKRAAETEAAKPVPATDERITIRGKVISTKAPGEYDVFPQTKVLVQHADGWKVWGSLPSALASVERGALVEFSAKIKPSDRDPKFGFFSRPTKAQIIEGAA